MSDDKLSIILLGGNAVGKSGFLERYVNNKITEWPNVTIGVAFGRKIVKVDNKNLIIQVWDTAGNERYYSLIRGYYKTTKVAIVCYDLLRPKTFEEAKFWVKDFKNEVKNCRIYLCGLKKDGLNILNEPSPSLDEVDKYVKEQQIKSFFLVSSKTGDNVDKVFDTIAHDYINNPIAEVETQES